MDEFKESKRKWFKGTPWSRSSRVFFLLIFSQGVQSLARRKTKAKTGGRPFYSLLIYAPTIQVVSCLQVLGRHSYSKALQGYDQVKQFASLGLYITALGFLVNSPHLLLLKGKNINASFAMLTTKKWNLLLQHKVGYIRKIIFARTRKGTRLFLYSLVGLVT